MKRNYIVTGLTKELLDRYELREDLKIHRLDGEEIVGFITLSPLQALRLKMQMYKINRNSTTCFDLL